MQTTTAVTPECAARAAAQLGCYRAADCSGHARPQPARALRRAAAPLVRDLRRRPRPARDRPPPVARRRSRRHDPAVDNAGSAVAQKFSDWDANRCSVAAANDVVREIGHDDRRGACERIRTSTMSCWSVTTACCRWRGSPTAPDRERERRTAPTCSPVIDPAARHSSPTNSSGPLGERLRAHRRRVRNQRGISVNDHELFVPDVALGRLVETPEDIGRRDDLVP